MLSGLAGALAMHGLRLAWERSFPDPRDGIFGFDKEADLASVQRLLDCDDATAQRVAWVLHYALGAVSGASYGALVDRFPPATAAKGACFGLALWLLADEMGMTLSGLAHPRRKTWRSHASAAVVHVAFVLTVSSLAR